MKRSSGKPKVRVWVFRTVLLLGLLGVLFLEPFPDLAPDQVNDTATITNYEASLVLSKNGDLSTQEVITTDLPPNKRGIFRIFDTADPRRSGVEHPVTIESISRDGVQEPYTIVDGATGTMTARIGDAEVTLPPGEYTYQIDSSTTGALEPGKTGETLWWWDVVGQGWQMPMQAVSISAELPTKPDKAECVQGKDTPCTASIEGTSLRIQTGPLEPFTAVTVRVSFPSNALPPPPSGSDDASPVAPIILLSLLTGLLAAGLAFFFIYLTRETEPGFPVLFEPPEGIFPALGVRILNEKHSYEAVQATLFDLAARGLLELTGDDDTWIVTLIGDPALLPQWPAETAMLRALGLKSQGDSFDTSKAETAGKLIFEARKVMQSGVDTASKPYLTRSRPGRIGSYLGWMAFFGSLYLIGRYLFGNDQSAHWPLLSALGVFAFIALGMMFDAGVRTKRTEVGRDVWSRVGGFDRFLSTESSESRFEAAEHLDWYPRYLPWAVALGSADAWAQRYQAQGLETPAVPWVMWAGTSPNFSMTNMNASFNSAIVGASAAYAASQSSSSSGGGGGFSGGSGGGGGGGGSW